MNTNTLNTRHATHLALTALATFLLSPIALAQQRPITGQMMDGRQPATTTALPAPDTTAAPVAREPTDTVAPPTNPAPAPTYYAAQVGDTTRDLLQLQASGDRAGPPRPMLGVEASISYQRYMKSFEHPIPEFYEATVGKTANKER